MEIADEKYYNCDRFLQFLKNDEDITQSFIISLIILDYFEFFFMTLQPYTSLPIPIRTETLADLKWGNIYHSHEARVITAFSKETEIIKYFHIFPIIFHKFFQKLTRKCHKISIKILKSLYEVFFAFFKFSSQFH